MAIFDYIAMGGWILLSLTLFYNHFFGYPKKKKQGRKELLDEMRSNNKKVSKKGKYGKMTDEQLDDYIDSITNNAQ